MDLTPLLLFARFLAAGDGVLMLALLLLLLLLLALSLTLLSFSPKSTAMPEAATEEDTHQLMPVVIDAGGSASIVDRVTMEGGASIRS